VNEPHLLCVALSPSVDVTYLVDGFAVGGTSRAHTVVRVPGGKGFNVARAARALGTSVVAAGIVGGHSGRWIAARLEAGGVPAALVDGYSETRTCMSVGAADGTLTEVYEQATSVTPDEWMQLVEIVRRTRARWVALSGSAPEGAPAGAVAALVDAAHERGARIALDTHGPALAAAVDLADAVKVNAAEAAELLGAQASPDELAAGLLAATSRPAVVVVTAGGDGAVSAVRDSPELLWARPPALTAHYPVGSGDSFLAGLLDVLAVEPTAVADALRRAVAAGSANALEPGAACFDPSTVAELEGRVEISLSAR
jgi:1-phosphofructokinase family hexose kinase